MSAEQTTTRRCGHCGSALVRKAIKRRGARSDHLEFETPATFAKRRFCDVQCWRAKQKVGRGEPQECECGCGQLTPWRGHGHGWGKYARGCYTSPKQKPRHPAWVNDGDGFWDWFAGFLDGEGFFGFIPRSFKRTYYTPVVRISLRCDDRAILEEIASKVGGRVMAKTAYGTSNPQSRWSLNSISDCLRLIEILDQHPLRAKKARDYATWRDAVLEKDTNGNTERLTALTVKLIADRKWKGGDAA